MIDNNNPLDQFLWGAATSSHQVEGANVSNDWWEWEWDGKVETPSADACSQYRLFPQDLELIESLGHTAHRFSLEWSRIESAENAWNEEGLAHYRDMAEALRRKGIEPVVTLNHFTLPQWLAEKGGWENPEAIHFFTRFAGKAIEAMGAHVRIWLTLNEPVILIYYGYLLGQWPPGKKSPRVARSVFRNLVLAHQHAYQKIHSLYEQAGWGPVYVSLAKHRVHTQPKSSNLLDRLFARVRNSLVNRVFLDAVQKGYLFFPGVFAERLPYDRCLDFIGLNYYTRHRVGWQDGKGKSIEDAMCEFEEGTGETEKNSLGWEVYPEGLYRELKDCERYRLPVLICENGIATHDDSQRERFIRSHLDAVARARREGVPVAGYLHWSLVDNFEWAEGYEPRFGLIEVNFENQERKIRPSAYVLSELCRKISRA